MPIAEAMGSPYRLYKNYFIAYTVIIISDNSV